MRDERHEIEEVAPLLPKGLPLGLRNYWYPLLQSGELPADRPVGVMALGEPIALWRDAAGIARAVLDRCPHRSIKLSVGRIFDGDLQCVLHGLRFDGEGNCTLIPWEQERCKDHERLAVRSYPVRELGGYVWVYVGDAEAFPPPPLESEIPEELMHPEEFLCIRLPNEVWNANWLLAIDGSDAYHAVTLHASSQAVEDRKWAGGRTEEAGVPLADRRVKIVTTSHGIRGVSVDKDGQSIHHGHFTVDVKGDRFTLPCIHTNPITPAPGVAPYAARLWQIPIDEKRTLVVRFLSWRASTAEERARIEKVFNDVALPRLQRVSAEDAFAAEAQGDVVEARRAENLLSPDVDLVRLRRLLRDAYVTQVTDSVRIAVPAGALRFPV